jgi:hypothetical protein
MASEKQIAANRANSKRSTGPKTAAGRARSSRNAYRHGLSLPLPDDPQTSAAIQAIAHAVAGQGATDDQLAAAKVLAEAQLDLHRIRATRIESTNAVLNATPESRAIERLLALDRFERLALSRRRSAKRCLDNLETASE